MSRDRGGNEGAEPGTPNADACVIVPRIDGYYSELVITSWLISDGQFVDSGVPLLTVSTDKVDVELPSPACGILEIIAELDTAVQVGETVAIIHLATHHNPKSS